MLICLMSSLMEQQSAKLHNRWALSRSAKAHAQSTSNTRQMKALWLAMHILQALNHLDAVSASFIVWLGCTQPCFTSRLQCI